VQIAVVTLFQEMLAAVTDYGVTGRAVSNGMVSVTAVDPRDFTRDRHRTVDDRPYGGGPGMVMLPEPMKAAIATAKARVADAGRPRSIYLSPQGRRLDQALVEELTEAPALVLVAGRYEGIDERLLAEVDDEISLGDFVLSGGELAAMALIDAVVRQLPGVLGHEASAAQDSFAGGLLDCPHYTRPETFEGRSVPSVLLSGDHEKIRRWRLKQSLGRTEERRPDLLVGRALTEEERELLAEYRQERREDRQD
jgi:tRNA (guanine37-N1)-methyltransferase